jgi:hypothetical protein
MIVKGPLDWFFKLKLRWTLPNKFAKVITNPSKPNITLYIGAEGVTAPIALTPN